MNTDLYLKKELATNIAEIVTMVKRGPSYPEKDFTTKQPTGRMEFLYIFRDGKGRELKHYAKEGEEATLSLFKPGEKLQVVRQEKVFEDGKRGEFLVWTDESGAESRAAATPQMHSNTAVDRKKREQDDYELKDIAHDWKLGIAGCLQAHITAGKDQATARKLAVEDATWIRKEAMRQAKGIPVEEPHPSGIEVKDLPF